MGFALQTLSFLGLTASIRLPAAAIEAILPPQPAPAAPPSYAVLTLNKNRSKSRRRARAAGSAPTLPDNAQMTLPLQASCELHGQREGPANRAPTALRIVQHSPREQPECLFISGRMADVCAALERMEARQGRLDS